MNERSIKMPKSYFESQFVIMLSLVHKSISAIRHMKSNGDSLDPFSTPVFMFTVFEIFPDTLTYCFLFSKYDSTHFRVFESKPYTFNLEINTLWSTKYQAELRSYMINRISFFSCSASNRVSKGVSNFFLQGC